MVVIHPRGVGWIDWRAVDGFCRGLRDSSMERQGAQTETKGRIDSAWVRARVGDLGEGRRRQVLWLGRQGIN